MTPSSFPGAAIAENSLSRLPPAGWWASKTRHPPPRSFAPGTGRACRHLLLPLRSLLQVLGLHVVELLEQVLAGERDLRRVDPLDLTLARLPTAPALGADGQALLQVPLAGATVGGRLAEQDRKSTRLN